MKGIASWSREWPSEDFSWGPSFLPLLFLPQTSFLLHPLPSRVGTSWVRAGVLCLLGRNEVYRSHSCDQ